jgi:hypothetical protein
MDGILVKKEALPMGLWKSNMQKQLDKKKNKGESILNSHPTLIFHLSRGR